MPNNHAEKSSVVSEDKMKSLDNEHQKPNPSHGPTEIPIHIENKMYKVAKTSITGAELRVLANPPIGADRDLFLVEQGPGDDRLIADNQAVELKPGMHFYCAPKTINPGKQYAIA